MVSAISVRPAPTRPAKPRISPRWRLKLMSAIMPGTVEALDLEDGLAGRPVFGGKTWFSSRPTMRCAISHHGERSVIASSSR